MRKFVDQMLKSVRNTTLLSYSLQLILVFLAYFFTAKGGLELDAVSGFATLVWPPAGIALIALLVWGYRTLPAIILAAFLVNFLNDAAFLVALGIASGNTLGAVVSVFLLRRVGFDLSVETIRDGLFFKFFTIVCAATAATIGATSLWLGGVVSIANYGTTWLAWFIGDALGVLIVGNLLLNIRKLFLRNEPSDRHWFEAFALGATVVLFCIIIFLNPFDLNITRSVMAVLVFLLSPLLIWAALRFGTIGAAFAIFGVSAVAIIGTVLGKGPFMTGGTLSQNLLLLQVFMGSLAVTTMILATAVMERIRANVRMRHANRKLNEQATALAEAQRIAQMGSWQWEVKTNMTTCSDELYHLLDFTQDTCRGVYPGILALVSPEDRKDLDATIATALRTKKPFEFDHQIVNTKGAVQWIRERGRVMLDERGEVMRITGTAQDVTNEKELDRAKTEFVALTSHQLRTPPSGIKWYTAMLLDEDVGKINPAQRRYLNNVALANQRMIDVVDNVLNISQIELGTFQNKPVPTDVCAIIDQIFAELSFEIAEKKIAVTRHHECGAVPILVDPALLHIVAQNLVTNAVKYTPREGTIAISARLAQHHLEIVVADSGSGIPKGEFSSIFQKFFRASNVQERYPRGTGLGLYIVKRILDQIKGTISFTSEVDKGATFSVVIPVEFEEKSQ